LKRYRWLWQGHNAEKLKAQLLSLANNEVHFLALDSNNHRDDHSRFDWLVGWGAKEKISCSSASFESLRNFHKQQRDWCLGHLSYELKNETEKLESSSSPDFNWPHLNFFIPQTIILAEGKNIEVQSFSFKDQAELEEYLVQEANPSPKAPNQINFEAQETKEEYLQKIASLKKELQYGNIYEINYCTEWKGAGKLNESSYYQLLNQRHQAPFSALYRLGELSLLCFSPERFLQKKGNKLICQPIKGTASRAADPREDQQLKEALLASEKERSENVMIVDLVRNDLSKTALAGTVKVPELFGIYSYQAVHQMVSTVESQIDPQYELDAILSSTFPMGSMTGAPKISAMKLIDRHENFNRELYSGSVGYISPEGDFDFNVVIRSIMHHRGKSWNSVRVGSAITIHCEAEREYEECLLKAEKVIN
jgi:para-aminobenzoate synthetase component 1